ncbi:hypothetical protein DWB77_05512 [Streptomyces hundungensis]|uniref:Uncharacterized protein n=2 Tax=Streptomyces hundungensis TaxID=1077946 RepID=A0A387HHH9_9ACTN|nr:hypothetical protein DWB77_05512 [Streptomyces hundungensis]
MTQTAQDGLNQPPDKLHALADMQYWQQTPLGAAFDKDRATGDQQLADLDTTSRQTVQMGGLPNPPGTHDVGEDRRTFYDQIGLTKWISERWWQDEGVFYDDPTPKMDVLTRQAVDRLGSPRYPSSFSDGGDGNSEERYAFSYMHDSSNFLVGAGADDARLFLAAGGFPRTAPQPGTPEYRIAVEDVKSRFVSCAWRDPLDPNQVLNLSFNGSALLVSPMR